MIYTSKTTAQGNSSQSRVSQEYADKAAQALDEAGCTDCTYCTYCTNRQGEQDGN